MDASEIVLLSIPAALAVAKLALIAFAVTWAVKGTLHPVKTKRLQHEIAREL